MSINELANLICKYLNRPCNVCVFDGEPPEASTFEIIYRTTILGHVGYVPVVGDSIFGYTVWEVDYEHRYAYVDK